MTTEKTGQNAQDQARYTRYYEHDGMLRAYANRSMLLAMVFAVIALSSFAFAVYVRLQPPEVDPIVWTEFRPFLDGGAGCPGGGR
jgi:hypothetical protein